MKTRTMAACVMAAGLAVGLAGAAAPVVGAGAADVEGVGVVVFGPPAICLVIECEEAGVKFGDGVLSKTRGYSADKAVGDGLKTLATSGDVLSHLETIRRMAVYLDRDEARANRVLAQLLARAAGAEADGEDASVRALAWLDAGFFAGALSHIGTDVGWKPGYAQGVQGLTWLERAAEAAVESGEKVDVGAVYFAAALVAHPAMRESKRDLYERFMREALGRAERGSLLAKNIEAHLEHFDESAASLRSAG
ncbi:MAG: hypothetical protein ACF8R9_09510 [Phycisphaerales bacterium JB054]